MSVREDRKTDAQMGQCPSQPSSLPSSERVGSNSKATQTARRPQAVNNYINVRESSSAMRAADLKSREAGGEQKPTPLSDRAPHAPKKKII